MDRQGDSRRSGIEIITLGGVWKRVTTMNTGSCLQQLKPTPRLGPAPGRVSANPSVASRCDLDVCQGCQLSEGTAIVGCSRGSRIFPGEYYPSRRLTPSFLLR